MTLLCITNEMNDTRSCTHKGKHVASCDGWEYRWNDNHDRAEATGEHCGGCLPRQARHGYLCGACWERVVTALADWPTFSVMIAGVDRAVQRDNGGRASSSLGYVPIPGTVLAVEELYSYLRSNTGNADHWVATAAGAKDAVRFARAMGAALRTHAVEEKAHKIRRTRCTSCSQLTLVWNPTQHEGGNVKVVCSNPDCKAELDQSSFEKIADIEKPRVASGIKATGGRDEFAEAFDPARPDHADLDPLSVLTTAQLRATLPPETPRLKYLKRAELIEAVHDMEAQEIA